MRATYHPVYNPHYQTLTRKARFGTSRTELLHLLVAVVILSTAITIWMQRGAFEQFRELILWQQIVLAGGISITGFALHEIGHKITAQHFGHWSEFRFNLPGLAATVAFSFAGILFGAPGATWHTATGAKDNGKISAAGPVINVLIAGLAFPLSSHGIGRPGFGTLIWDGVLIFNTVLAVFNLIPIWQLDGRKILRWNPFAYAILVGLVAMLVYYADPLGIWTQ